MYLSERSWFKVLSFVYYLSRLRFFSSSLRILLECKYEALFAGISPLSTASLQYNTPRYQLNRPRRERLVTTRHRNHGQEGVDAETAAAFVSANLAFAALDYESRHSSSFYNRHRTLHIRDKTVFQLFQPLS